MLKKKRIIRSDTPTTRKKVKSVAPTAMEYIMLFNTCEIKKEKVAEVDKIIDEKIVVNRARYEAISNLVKSGGNANNLMGSQPLFQSSYISFYNRFSAAPQVADSLGSKLFNFSKPSFGFNALKKFDFVQGKYVDANDQFGLN